jgi:H+/Cl- antiporter ClcA
LGLETISDALDPSLSIAAADIHWYDFILKTLFTSLTLGAGGSGGIITPIFFVGTTSGTMFGQLIGDHILLFSALGFVSVLAGTTNTPIAAIIMAVELFGVHVANYAGLSVVIAFLITGHRSVFKSQRIELNKADNITLSHGDDIEHTNIDLDMKDIEKVRRLKNRLKYKGIKWQVKNYKNSNKR